MSTKTKSNTKRSNGAGGLFKRAQGGCWIARWTDHEGQRRTRTTGTTDKRAAERILGEWTSAEALRRSGVVDHRAEATAAAGRSPIADHVAAFAEALTSKGNTLKHVTGTRNRVERLLASAGVRSLGEFQAAPLLGALRRDREAGASLSTSNAGIRALKSFSRWCVADHRQAVDPMAGVKLFKAETDRRHVRRVLRRDELDRLLEATEAGKMVRGLTGADRAMLYRTAAGTGFRLSELASLTPASFSLGVSGPVVTLQASSSKRRQEDAQPIAAGLATRLRHYLAGRDRKTRLWPLRDDAGARTLRVDLEAAGIPYRDEDGRVADFHALRSVFVSAVVNGGATIKEAQTLARHSDPKLTMNLYAQVQLADLRRAVPDFDEAAVGGGAGSGVVGRIAG